MRRALERYDLIRTIRSSLREDKIYDFIITKAEVSEVAPEAAAEKTEESETESDREES
jgi:hypothetical protein